MSANDIFTAGQILICLEAITAVVLAVTTPWGDGAILPFSLCALLVITTIGTSIIGIRARERERRNGAEQHDPRH